METTHGAFEKSAIEIKKCINQLKHWENEERKSQYLNSLKVLVATISITSTFNSILHAPFIMHLITFKRCLKALNSYYTPLGSIKLVLTQAYNKKLEGFIDNERTSDTDFGSHWFLVDSNCKLI